MGIPLFLGIGAYVLIIIIMTVWLTRYHLHKYQNEEVKEVPDLTEQGMATQKPTCKDLQTTSTSGKQSLSSADRGGLNQDH